MKRIIAAGLLALTLTACESSEERAQRHYEAAVALMTAGDPDRRILLQVTLDDAAAADEIFAVLMGEDVESRRSFIQRNAKDVRFLDI